MPQPNMRTFLLRRLHSLSGVFPLGVFLVEHLYINSFALKGAERFNAQVAFMHGLPYLAVLEVLVIALPLMFHTFYGLWIVYTGQVNVLRYPYFRNWTYLIQRLSGLITVVFVGVHLWQLRLQALFYGAHVDFEMMATVLAQPGMLAFYLVGVLASLWHFANGLWAFFLDWGIAIGPRSQRHVSWACNIMFVVLSVVAVRALLAFLP